jgi:hypothetical protein
VATIALMLTGLSRELARFEARSAFTGTGFPSPESESVVNHPVRREIIMLLMVLGNVGIVTVVSSLVLAFVGSGGDTVVALVGTRVLVLGLGLFLLWRLATSEWIDLRVSRLITWALKRYTHLDVHDYVGLLHLAMGYEVAVMTADEGDWLANKSLLEMRLGDEGVLVLGIERHGEYIGAPKAQVRLEVGDKLLVYGPQTGLTELDHRPKGDAGDQAHQSAVDRQRVAATADDASLPRD